MDLTDVPLHRLSLISGATFITAVINLPQKFQVVNKVSPVGAGWRMLPLMLSIAVAAGVAGYIIQRLKIPPLYLFLVAGVLQTIGLALTGTLSGVGMRFSSVQYAFEVIMGLGMGLGLSTLIVALPTIVESADGGTSLHFGCLEMLLTIPAVTMGALGQARVLGGSIGVAIATNILNHRVRSGTHAIPPNVIKEILASTRAIDKLDKALQQAVRHTFAKGYDQQFQMLAGLGGATILLSCLMFERKPRRMQ